MSISEEQLAEVERLYRVAVDAPSATPEYESAKILLAAMTAPLALEVRRLQAEVARMCECERHMSADLATLRAATADVMLSNGGTPFEQGKAKGQAERDALQAEVARMKSAVEVAVERAEKIVRELELVALGRSGYLADSVKGADELFRYEVIRPLRALL